MVMVPGAGLLIIDKFAFTIHLPTAPEFRLLAKEYRRRFGRAKGSRQAKWLYEPEGCRFWVWLLARKSHPTLRPDDLKLLITSANVVDVLSVLADIERKSSAVAAPVQ